MEDVAVDKEDQAQKARVQATFDRASPGYDRSPLRFFRKGAEQLVSFAAVEPGQRVLDVATGTGWVALAAAAKVGPRGKVVGIDLSPGMLSKAREKARHRKLLNIAFRLGDVQRLPYRSATFDTVLAAQAIFFMPHPLRALREWRRVLKPGGCLAIASQGRMAFEPMMKMYWKLLKQRGVPVPSPSGPSFETARECRRYLQAAGLRDVWTSVTELGYRLSDVNAWWTIVRHTAMGGGIRRLAPKDRPRFRREHLQEVGSLCARDGIPLPMPTIFAAGRKPETRKK